ncbi:methionyl-tRNA formyltransferase [Streptomyces sp. NPDC101249]|uniref:methionyl-tRNA formyltransferase n=1 Tax=Streptomyces sp. NPDC101249 TaxID=3366140 RepID=UPI003800787E
MTDASAASREAAGRAHGSAGSRSWKMKAVGRRPTAERMNGIMPTSNARIVLMTSFLPNYQLLATWAERHGHEIALVVTPPGGSAGSGEYGASALAGGLGKGVGLLVTGKLRTVAAPLIAALAPDLVISAGFARLIPQAILDIPASGALNLHPSALPAGRGPNPIRLVYEGAETIGATLHRTEAAFDTGAVLSRRERPLPENLSGPALLAGWLEMFAEVVEEGADKALRGETGIPQDPLRVSHAALFTTEEQIIDFTEPAAVICRKAAALNVLGTRAHMDLPAVGGFSVRHVEPLNFSDGTPGTVVAAHDDGWTVQAADRAVRVITGDRSPGG